MKTKIHIVSDSMKTYQQQNSVDTGEIQRAPNRLVSFVMNIMLPTAALACGLFITMYLLKTSPEAQPRKRPPTATLVEVQTVIAGPQKTIIPAMGEIIAAREVDLRPRVSGEVIEINEEFIPGGYFSAGQNILQIDPADYALIVEQLESEAAKAENDMLLEMGNQRIAEKELILLNETVSQAEKALILRQPQLGKLEASQIFAQSKLAQARLNLVRTEIKAPFNAVIATRNVNIGTRVNESSVLARLVGSDSFWLRLTLPVEHLQWVKIPNSRGEVGSAVKIYAQGSNGSTEYRLGRVIRLAASLEEQGRMAQLYVEVDDPLSRRKENMSKTRLLLGSYVRAEIEGTGVEGGIKIDRSNIHDGGKIWVMNDDGQLEIRNVDITFRSSKEVIITDGVAGGERIITSSLSSPIAGIPLRLATENSGESMSRKGDDGQPGSNERRGMKNDA